MHQTNGEVKSKAYMGKILTKIISFLATLLIQFLSILTLKLLDNFSLIILIFIACIITGYIFRTNTSSTSPKKEIGWGLFYGSIASLLSIIVFMIWLSFNFPK